MNIEDFIRENRSEFECRVMPEGHRERFMRSLQKSDIVAKREVGERSTKTVSLLTIWYSMAAAAIVTAAVILSGFHFGSEINAKLPQPAENQIVEMRNVYDKKVDEVVASLEDVMVNVDDSTRIKITEVIDNLLDVGEVFSQIAPLPEEKQIAIVEQIYDNRIKTIERISDKISSQMYK